MRLMQRPTWSTITACLLLAAPALAAGPACQDTNAIQWYFPGSFTEAQTAAAKQKRLLMIKGIAFGIDAVGAKCATKGCW